MNSSIRRMTAAAAAAAFLWSLGVLGLAPARANSGVRNKIEAQNRQAMESYDLLDYEAAKRLLNEAVGLAKKHGLKDAAVARTYLNLAIVYFSGFKDVESAKIAFIDAVQLDPGIQIDPAYRTDELVQLLSETREEYGGAASQGGGAAGSGCAAVIGIEHTLVNAATSGEPREITALVSGELGARKVVLYYRSRGSTDYREANMKKTGECEYTGSIPGDAVAGDAVHYYVAALNRAGKTVASRGSSASPNIIEVSATGGGSSFGGDSENPLGGGGEGGDVEKGAEVGGGGGESLFLLIPVGTGGGYVTGQTEQMDNDVGCCFAPALFNISPEIGYFINQGMAVAAAFRMGFPVGANLPGHATGAPSGLLRLRYGPSGSLRGLHIIGSAGAGLLRHTIKLSEAPAGMDTDTVASGPLLLGAGLAYWKDLGGPMRFTAEVHSLAGVPVVKEMGTCPGAACVTPSFSLHFDVNLGILFSF